MIFTKRSLACRTTSFTLPVHSTLRELIAMRKTIDSGLTLIQRSDFQSSFLTLLHSQSFRHGTRTMRYRAISAIISVLGAALVAATTAQAGDLRPRISCGLCSVESYPAAGVTYAAPIYYYAPPTITIVPRIVVQPHYVLERTYVANETRFVREHTSCWTGCEPHLVVNQGQFADVSAGSPEYRFPLRNPAGSYHKRYRYYVSGYGRRPDITFHHRFRQRTYRAVPSRQLPHRSAYVSRRAPDFDRRH